MNVFDLSLDLNKSRNVNPIRLRQGDLNGTTIRALVFDHGALADLSGTTARWVMRLPGGEEYYRKAATVDATACTVTVEVDETQAASVSGRCRGYFQILDGSTVIASTGDVLVEVLPDALEGATVAESYDSAIQDAIDDLNDAIEAIPDTVEDVLEAHPEWTTTVQDGAVTDAKLYQGKGGILARNARLMHRLDNLLTAALPEGDSATATDAAKTPLAGLSLYGRSTQDGTPTPSAPVSIESVAAANLVDYLTNYYAAAVSLVDGKLVNEATDSKTFATPVIQTMLNGTVQETFYFSNQNVTYAGTYGRMFVTTKAFDSIRIKHNGSSNDIPFVVQGMSGKVGVSYYATITFDGTNPSVVGGMVASDIALYESTRSQAYTPYGTVGLWTRGKNLLLGSQWARNQLDNGITWTVNADGSVHAKGTSTGTAQVYWLVPAADVQTFGGMLLGGAPNVSGCSVRLEMRGAPYTVYAADTTGAGATISLPSSGAADASLMCRVDSGKTVDVTFRPMIRRAGTSAEFVPYTATVTPIPLGGHELRSLPDGTRDELTVGADGRVTLVQRVGAVTFDGSENWQAASASGVFNLVLWTQSGGTLIPASQQSGLCDRLTWDSAGVASMADGTFKVGSSGTSEYAFIVNKDYTTATEIKAWLAENPTTVLYRLPPESYVTHDLGWTDAVPLCGPDLTAQAVPTAPFALTYERDLNTTLARLEAALAALA